MIGMVAASVTENMAPRTAEDLLRLASLYETEARHHAAQALQYQERAIDTDPITDTKGYQRQGLIVAASSTTPKPTRLCFEYNCIALRPNY